MNFLSSTVTLFLDFGDPDPEKKCGSDPFYSSQYYVNKLIIQSLMYGIIRTRYFSLRSSVEFICLFENLSH
jgi:hypothetical protein